MLTLAEFQSRVTAELLHPANEGTLATGRESGLAAQALRVHRGTILGVWEKALQLTYPALFRLLAPEGFEVIAQAYARAHLPQEASLEDFGASFPQFLAAHPETQRRRHLIDLARFEHALERAEHQPKNIHSDEIALDAHIRLRLLRSVRVMGFEYPVDLIRDAVDAGCPEPLANLNLTPQVRHFAIWRGTTGATVKSISRVSGQFLEAVLRGASADYAIEMAMKAAEIPAPEVIAAIQAEVLTASFLQIIHQPLSGN